VQCHVACFWLICHYRQAHNAKILLLLILLLQIRRTYCQSRTRFCSSSSYLHAVLKVRVNLGKGFGLFLTFFFSPFLSVSHSCSCSSCRLLSRGTTVGGCWNSDSKSGEFEYQPFCFHIITNLGKVVHSYTHVSLSPSDIISVAVNGQGCLTARKVVVCVFHRWPCVTDFGNLSSIYLRVQGRRNRDEHPAYTSLWVGLYGTLCAYLGITVLLSLTIYKQKSTTLTLISKVAIHHSYEVRRKHWHAFWWPEVLEIASGTWLRYWMWRRGYYPHSGLVVRFWYIWLRIR